jgi:hypothetical protein
MRKICELRPCIFPSPKLLGTCRKHPTVDEYRLCEDSFQELLEYQFQHGHVPDDKFEEFEFPRDEDPNEMLQFHRKLTSDLNASPIATKLNFGIYANQKFVSKIRY